MHTPVQIHLTCRLLGNSTVCPIFCAPSLDSWSRSNPLFDQLKLFKYIEAMASGADPIIQYVLVRGDLAKILKWPSGAVIAQACHACVAATHLFQDDPNTQAYLKDLDNMHKAVLELPNEESLRKIEATLKENNIDHKVWTEQPENIPTCIALKPYPKTQVKNLLKNFRLMKD